MPRAQPEITGAVVDAQGNPIAEARVYFVEGPVALPDISALTDADGRFALSVPAPGTYRLGVSAEGAAGVVQETAEVEAAEEKSADLEVRLATERCG
jgi:hypothetical protein